MFTILTALLLHDADNFEQPPKGCSREERSAHVAKTILRSLDVPQNRIAPIEDGILATSGRGSCTNRNELIIVQSDIYNVSDSINKTRVSTYDLYRESIELGQFDESEGIGVFITRSFAFLREFYLSRDLTAYPGDTFTARASRNLSTIEDEGEASFTSALVDAA